LRLPKHRRLLLNRADVKRLARRLESSPADVLHAHLDNAHGVAIRARRALRRGLGLREAGRRPLVVRSLYDDTAPARTLRHRWLHAREADGIFVFGESVRRTFIERFGLPEGRVVRLDGAVDSTRFRPLDPAVTPRERLGIPAGAIVAGIVARIQRHRRFDVLLEAFRRALAEVPELHLLVLGRGTHARELAQDRARSLGIAAHVGLPGYVAGDDYPPALACCDFKIFLVPGTDGTCRAVREAMATGLPVICSRRGLLPEIVRDGQDGLVVDDEPAPLARAMVTLARDEVLRRTLGASALRRAREDFSLGRQAEMVLAAYRRWLDAP
jgi:glycosyltransferase involved in cell wall biosynthesis